MKVGLCMVIGVAVVALGIGLAPACASEFRSGSVIVPQGTTLDDELYAFGQNVTVSGEVTGDLLAFAAETSVPGKIGQSASVMAGNVNVSGPIGSNLRAVGGDVTLSGTVADNASVFGGSVLFTKTSSVGRDLQAAAGDLRIEGSVGRNVLASGGEVTLNGKIGGNVTVNAGQLRIGPDAVIRGNLTYTAPQKANIAQGARILGEKTYQPTREKRPAWIWKSALWVWSFLALFLVGVIMIAVAPVTTRGAADKVMGAPGVSLLAGLILLVVVPPLVVFLLITLIGIPLGLILLAMYVFMIYFSRAFAGLAIGRWLFARFGRPEMSLYVDLLVGLLILWLLMAIPFVGALIHIAAILLGLGALAVQRYSMMRELRGEGRI